MNIFDIIGPIMIGPSSSHTAGAVRMGRVAWKILGEDVAKADIGLVGSFAMTYKGHGTDKALIAGIMGMRPDDERIPRAMELAKEAGLEYSFSQRVDSQAHPNTALLELVGKQGGSCSVEGVSIGGGNIKITKLNGMAAAFNGDKDTLIIALHDRPGALASVTERLAHFGVNIGGFRLSRPRKNQLGIMTIELDSAIEKLVVQELRELKDIVSIVYKHPAQ